SRCRNGRSLSMTSRTSSYRVASERCSLIETYSFPGNCDCICYYKQMICNFIVASRRRSGQFLHEGDGVVQPAGVIADADDPLPLVEDAPFLEQRACADVDAVNVRPVVRLRLAADPQLFGKPVGDVVQRPERGLDHE